MSQPRRLAISSRSVSEPGHKVELDITVKRNKDFKGRVEAQWIGIPRGVVCATPAIQADSSKLKIVVDIGAKAPPGRHRGFRLRLLVHTPRGVVTNEFRSGEIRIDRPQKKKATPAVGTGSGS